MNKLIILIVAVLLGISLSACGSTPDAQPASSKTTSLTGSWTTDSDPDFEMHATVGANDIVIMWVSPSDESKSLYWKGTFNADGGSHILSKADTDALESSLLGSQDKSKQFTYDDDELSFEMSVMGTTKTIHLHRK